MIALRLGRHRSARAQWRRPRSRRSPAPDDWFATGGRVREHDAARSLSRDSKRQEPTGPMASRRRPRPDEHFPRKRSSGYRQHSATPGLRVRPDPSVRLCSHSRGRHAVMRWQHEQARVAAPGLSPVSRLFPLRDRLSPLREPVGRESGSGRELGSAQPRRDSIGDRESGERREVGHRPPVCTSLVPARRNGRGRGP